MRKIVSVVGAGGKTTYLHRLADAYTLRNYKVLLITTTHMGLEADTDISCDAETIRRKLRETGYCMAGKDDGKGKIGPLPPEVLQQAMEEAEMVLVEADGAKHFWAKYPAAHEPVILPGTTDLVILMGLETIGKKAGEAVFRFEQLHEALGIEPDETVTLSLLERIIETGYLQRLKGQLDGVRINILFTKIEDEELTYLTKEEAGKLYAQDGACHLPGRR